jgi:hypothetical protein
MIIQAKIQSANGPCIGTIGTEEKAIETICAQSRLGVHPAEAQILRHANGSGPTGIRYVMAGRGLIGSYSLSEYVLVETMPDHLRGSHRAARNFGAYPANGSIREWVNATEAEELVENDPDGYNRIVRR